LTEIATVIKEMYVDILCRCGDAIRRERPPKNGEPAVGF